VRRYINTTLPNQIDINKQFRRMNKVVNGLMFILLLNVTACNSNNPEIKLQTGDLLFRGGIPGKLSEAIDKVTQTRNETHFSHVGLVEITANKVFVLHASSKEGTCRVSLQEFLQQKGDSVKFAVFRLKSQWQKTIPKAIDRAKKMLDKPYNFSYKLSDTAHYCSEFVYQAFVTDSIFELKPMTFKDSRTDDFLPTWVEYYNKLNFNIPEGLPGCNPNVMAASDKLKRLGVIKIANKN